MEKVQSRIRKYRKTTLELIGNKRFYKDWINKDKHAIVDPEGKVIEKFRIKATAFHRMKELQKDYFCEELKIVDLDWDGNVVTKKGLT